MISGLFCMLLYKWMYKKGEYNTSLRSLSSEKQSFTDCKFVYFA